jgi:O-antigen ligase
MAFPAAAVAFLAPLILTPRLLYYYDITPKVAILMLAAALALAAACFELDSWSAFARSRWGRWYLVAAAGSVVISGIAAWRSAEHDLAWYGSNWRRMGALTEFATVLAAVWIAQRAARSQRDLAMLLRATCWAGLLASLYGIAQYLGWDPILPRDAYAVGEGVFEIVRPPGTLGHSDYFAAFLVWPVFAGWALSAAERTAGWRWLGLTSAVAGSIAIVLSGSRGALLGLACGVAVRMLLKRPAWRSVAAVASIAIAAFAGFYISPAGERLRARVHWIEEDPVGGARLLLWRDSLSMAAQRPLIGVGPDAFSAEFPKFESAALARAYPDFYHESPHNLPLDVLTGEGVLGLLALAAVIFAAIAGGLQARRSNLPVALAFLPGLAATLAAHQFAVWIAPTAFYFYIGAGVLAGAGCLKSHKEPSPVRRIAPVWRGVALIGGLAGAVLLAAFAYRLVAEDGMLAKVQRRLDAGDLTGAARAYMAALQRPDAGVTADLYFSRRWSKVGMDSSAAMAKIYYSQIAAGAASRATHQPEQAPNAWYNLSVLAAARNDAAGTEYALRQAIATAPNWYKPHWTLARLLAAEGRSAEAVAEAGRAIELNGGKDGEVASTLAQVLRSGEPRP